MCLLVYGFQVAGGFEKPSEGGYRLLNGKIKNPQDARTVITCVASKGKVTFVSRGSSKRADSLII